MNVVDLSEDREDLDSFQAQLVDVQTLEGIHDFADLYLVALFGTKGISSAKECLCQVKHDHF